MTIRYLSTSGTDAGSATTAETAWRTLAYACANMSAGDRLRVLPGTYAGAGTFGQEPPSGTDDDHRTIIESHGGDVVIDGSDTQRCISLAGSSYVTLRGLSFRNLRGAVAGWSITECVGIRDLNNTPGEGRNAHHVRVTHCRFLECTRRDAPLRGAVPLQIVCYSDERLGEEAAHHIEVDHCEFHESQSDMKDAEGNTVFAISQVGITGNVRDWYFHDNVFYHNFAHYNEGNGAIEFVANYSQEPGFYLTYPDQPRKGIIRRNACVFTGENATLSGIPYAARYAFYPTGCADVKVEFNFFYNWPLGIGLVAEDGSSVHNTMSRVWVRCNYFYNPEQYAIVIGTWASNYLPVEDVWVTNNTIIRDFIQAGAFPPITILDRNGGGLLGDYGIFDNYVECADQVLMTEVELDPDLVDRNAWVSPVTNAFRYPDFSTLVPFPYIADCDLGGDHLDSGDLEGVATRNHLHRRSPTGGWSTSAWTLVGLRPNAWVVGRGQSTVPPWRTTGIFGAYDDGDEDLDIAGRERQGETIGAIEGGV